MLLLSSTNIYGGTLMYQRLRLPGLLVSMAFVLGLLANVGSAQAVPLFPGSNLLSDDSAEILRNADGSTCGIGGGTCIVDVGDRLVGIANFHRVEQGAAFVNVGAGTAFNEFTAVFDIQVATKVGTAATGITYTFVPTSAANFLADTGVAVPATTMAAFFDDPAKDFNRGGTIAAGFASATNGALWWLAGQTVGTDFWFATTGVGISDDISALGNAPPGANRGFFNFGLHQIPGGIGPTLVTELCPDQLGVNRSVNFCGNGSLTGKDPASQFNSYDQAQVAVTTPEPSALLLLGSGLAGLGFWRSRRKA
jgi:hypothetical protein